jgi:dihydroorotase
MIPFSQIRITGGRVVDPGSFDGIADILIDDGKIVDIITASGPDAAQAASPRMDSESQVIDARGKIVAPGLIDMHVHLREPGHEYKETLASGCQAAARGGFSAICAMPNTLPVNDNREVCASIIRKAVQLELVRVYPVAAISKGLEGRELCEFGEMKGSGAVAVTDDGMPVIDSGMMRAALTHAKEFDLVVISHCEDLNLSAGGVMNEGALAIEMGLAGIPNASESIMVMRDIALSELTRVPVHIAHVSTAESVAAIRSAKEKGIAVTAETAPHYFTLTENAVREYKTNAKMNPPLRSHKDRQAIRSGLADGTIDVIATDHAPHSVHEKSAEFHQAPNGIIGLETAVSLSLRLVDKGVLSLPELIAKMSLNPAKILKLENGIKIGQAADISIIDTEKSFTVDAASFASLSRNTPFNGWQLKGKAVLTMVAGKIIFSEEME